MHKRHEVCMGCTLMVVAIESPCGCAVCCCCCMLQFKNCKQDVIGAPQGQKSTHPKPQFSHYIGQHELKGQLRIK